MHPPDSLSLSERLIMNVETVGDLISPLLCAEAAESFLGADAAPLLQIMDGPAIARLAFISEYVQDILSVPFDHDGADLSHQFFVWALDNFKRHLDGWDYDENGNDLGLAGFFRRIANTSCLFGFDCSITRGLAPNIASRIDAHLDQPFVLEHYVSMRETIIRELILADGRVTAEEHDAIDHHNALVAKQRRLARELRRSVKGDGDAYVQNLQLSNAPTNSHTTVAVSFDVVSEANASKRSAPAGALKTDASGALQEARRELSEMIGLPRAKDEVKRLDAFLEIQRQRAAAGLPASHQALHFIFYGNPGTGKTTVARILGKFLRGHGILKSGHVIETDRAGLVAEYVGQTAIKTDAKIREAMDGIIFIDEAYALAAGGGQHDYGKESVDTLLKRMEDNRDRLVVIAAGYPEPMTKFIDSNPGLRSRFTRYLHFDDYSPEEMGRITSLMLGKGDYTLTPAARACLSILFTLAYARRDEKFGNGRFVRNICEEMCNRQALRLTGADGRPSKEALQTMTGADVPLDQVGLDDALARIDVARWGADCPDCRRRYCVKAEVLGREVKCTACERLFTIEWLPLVEHGIEGITVDPKPRDPGAQASW